MQLELPKSGEEIAIVKTNMGDFKIKFFPDIAPKTTENFKTHSKNGYYNGIIFHRVINDFMIQCGDPTGTGRGGKSIWETPFKDEFSPQLRNYRGALSMANAGANTNGSQFFIVQNSYVPPSHVNGQPEDVKQNYTKLGGTPWLDGKHTVFGQVFEGMETIDAIANLPVGAGDKPVKDIKIIDIEIAVY
jgi:peptidyl-prolyl cis-trans isomerase B (cyclophilin B)